MKMFWIAVSAGLCLGMHTSAVVAGECETAAKTTRTECVSQCADASCKTVCARAQKTAIASCRRPATAAKAGPFKGAGTAASPYEVGTSLKATTLQLDEGRRELHFALQAPKDGQMRLYLTDYTGPIDLTFEGAAKAETTHFIKAPDYPAYARYDVMGGQRHVYALQLVGAPTSVTLRTVLDESCRLDNQFMSLPFGGTCKDQE